jgi:lactoylglutathione lyase
VFKRYFRQKSDLPFVLPRVATGDPGDGFDPELEAIASRAGITHLSERLAKEVPMAEPAKPRVVGFNHIALEVGDIDEALAFYGRLFTFKLRGKSDSMAFIDLGDQFLALQKGRRQTADDGRHFGLVVDDKEAVRDALKAAGVALLEGPFLDFRDPWGNRVEIVSYDNVQFTKAPNVLRGMGLIHLAKNQKAKKELAEKGMALEYGSAPPFAKAVVCKSTTHVR